MKKWFSWKAMTRLTCHRISSILRNTNVRYRLHNSPPLAHILSKLIAHILILFTF
jgi:hypothetical protein